MQHLKKLKLHFNSPAILIFAIACFLILILDQLTHGNSNMALFCVYRSSLLSPLTWIRFFTHVLGHSSWSHLLNNMMLLLIVGPMLEEKYGWKFIVLVMAVTAFVTGVIHVIFFPNTALLGASGIVFAFILLSSFSSAREGTIPVTFLLVAILYIGEQIVQGIVVEDSISNLSHILGGLVGTAAGFFATSHMKAKQKPAEGQTDDKL